MIDPLRPSIDVERGDDGMMSVKVRTPESTVVKATPLTGFLQLVSPTSAEQDKLKEIWSYVEEMTDSELETERLWAVRNIEQKLAAPRLGQTRLDQLYQYVTTDRQAKAAEKLRDSLLR